MSEFRINISNLSEGLHDYRFEAGPSKIDLDERFNEPVRLRVKLDKSSRQILLSVEITTEGMFICDRCLSSFTKKLECMYSLVYVQGDRSTIDLKKEDDIQVLSADTNYIDLDEDVRQFLLLSIPQKLLCQEECIGLCPICGINKNRGDCTCTMQTTDTRWDALKKLSHN